MVKNYYPFLSRTPDDLSRPLLPILITNPTTNIPILTYGLIDTGSDDCVIPTSYAEAMGHVIPNGNKEERLAAGAVVYGYKHTFEIDIYGIDEKGVNYNDKIHYIPNSLVLCMDSLNIVLLGVKDFLEHFNLMISYPKHKFTLLK
jgi:hypothetical protein